MCLYYVFKYDDVDLSVAVCLWVFYIRYVHCAYLWDMMFVFTGLFKLTTYVHVVGMENAGLSGMLSRRVFGGGLWGKPLRKIFRQHVSWFKGFVSY